MRTVAPAFTDGYAVPDSRRDPLGPVALQIAVTGFIAGHSWLPNEWLHLGWLLLAGLPALAWTDPKAMLGRWCADSSTWLLFTFLTWMILRSCLCEPVLHGHASAESLRGILGVLLLVLFCILTWALGSNDGALRFAGRVMGFTSALAALLSIVLCYFVLPGHHPGERLTNLLVHGGLNPVCTGLIFGFAGVWLAALVEKDTCPRWRWAAWAAITLLHLAAFLTGSRGAMLALLCGHAALLASRGFRRGAAAAAVFVLTGALYFTSAPVLAQLAQWRAGSGTLSVQPLVIHHLQLAVDRRDSGRLDIYRAGWNAMDNLWLGTGQWGVRDVWQCDLQPDGNDLMSHLHGAFFATFVHGGVIGVALLLSLLGCAVWRVWNKDATWVALLAFGCGGLFFDGESLASLATAPRFEGLLFWLPLMVALAKGRGIASSSQTDQPPRLYER